MPFKEKCFTSFKESIDSYVLPEQFTFPFYYEPHPLCLLAAKELQCYLKTQKEWQHEFGITANCEAAIGKMFGVLLVQTRHNEIGYLAAFSGKLAEQNLLPGFVPPVFDLLTEDGFFSSRQLVINQLNEQIARLENKSEISQREAFLKAEKALSIENINDYKNKIVEGRKIRKAQRIAAERELNEVDFLHLKEKLSQESIKEKLVLRDLKNYWRVRIKDAEANLASSTAELLDLKKQRKDLSASLQKKIFKEYQFLNINGVKKSLYDIFKETSQPVPPAGAGECAAPKLLHYAFKWGMKPLAMAEFWWGASPKSAIRKHKNFYPACQSKCQPILAHMLKGIKMDENPLLNNPAAGKSLDFIYEDDSILVINKPADFLSVPGKNIEDSVYLRIKQAFPEATGPLIVHRLDMSTSGLMVIALSSDAYKKLQRQFMKRTVKKRYVALLDGLLEENTGLVELPLRVDLDDRPKQLVCYEHGKAAITQWEVIERKDHQTRVHFYPITGRTHQLRVHAAHIKGLNIPILGDDLYGKKANRLHLHAEYIEFCHPVSSALISFRIDAQF